MTALLRISIVIALACLPRAGASQQVPRNAADSLAITLAIYRVAVRNGTQTAFPTEQPVLVCVMGQKAGVDPSTAVLASLQEDSTVMLRPMSACRRDRIRRASDNTSLVVDTLTGKRGISISADEPKFTSDSTFSVGTGYYQHGLSSAGWLCEGQRSDGRWQIVKCRMLWIS